MRQNTKILLRKETRYKQASDNSSWFEERRASKALVEAGALRERERALQAIFDAVGGALRAQHGFPSRIRLSLLYLKSSRQRSLRCLDTLELLRRRLAWAFRKPLRLKADSSK